jgi:hypothetical protein
MGEALRRPKGCRLKAGDWRSEHVSLQPVHGALLQFLASRKILPTPFRRVTRQIFVRRGHPLCNGQYWNIANTTALVSRNIRR